MEKRAALALVLSFLVVMAYQYMFAPPPPLIQPPPEVAQPADSGPPDLAQPADSGLPEEPEAFPAPAPAEETASPPARAPAAADETVISVETDLYSARLSSIGGTVKSWDLKKFRDEEGAPIVLLKEGGIYRALGLGWKDDFSLSEASFDVSGRDLRLDSNRTTGTVVFTYRGPNYSVRRTYTFHNEGYNFDLKDEVSGLENYQVTLGADFGINEKESLYTHVGPAILKETDRIEIKPKKLKETRLYMGNIKWIALEDKYFFSCIVPVSAMQEAKAWKYQDSAAIALMGRQGTNEVVVYAGPKEYYRLKALGMGLEHVVDFGFFSPISRPLFWVLKQFHSMVGNYGWAIVLLTLVVRIPFIPIVNKGQKSMKRLQELQPRMKEIREKYKKDSKRMQEEMMGLYKKHKVNPMGGCLPIMLQIPVFFALYKVLLVSIELRGSPFIFWITDLSQKDPFYVLPLVMGATMFLQQKMTPAAGDPRQQKMMMFMPVIFTFLFLNFASGLVLYWLINNLLSIAQQAYVNKSKS
jgi:YidC/Oxa1 family membrane protein insertase